MFRLALTAALCVTVACGMGFAPSSSNVRAQDKKVQPKQPKLPAGTAEHRDLRYGEHKERNTLNLFVPKADKPLPLIIWIHGGAWSAGSKDGNNPAMRFLGQGFAVAAINYRLSQHAVYPAQIQDCKEAVRFLRANAKKYNLNPDAFGVCGASAGGHLVALLGTSGGVKELALAESKHKDVSDKVQCVVDFFGPTDLLKMAAQSGPNSKIDHNSPKSPESRLIGGAIQENKEKAAKANPITYIDKDDAPFLILHGDMDPLVPPGQSELLHEALKKAGVPSELVVIKGGGHGGSGFATAENQDKIAKFFDKHLKK
ncbi:MAG: alpha/beta hydrolase [Planctomycetia bacterium]|nr:alpha/beta hydrolase [Planctomycetia bacterium]